MTLDRDHHQEIYRARLIYSPFNGKGLKSNARHILERAAQMRMEAGLQLLASAGATVREALGDLAARATALTFRIGYYGEGGPGPASVTVTGVLGEGGEVLWDLYDGPPFPGEIDLIDVEMVIAEAIDIFQRPANCAVLREVSGWHNQELPLR